MKNNEPISALKGLMGLFILVMVMAGISAWMLDGELYFFTMALIFAIFGLSVSIMLSVWMFIYYKHSMYIVTQSKSKANKNE